MKRLTALSNQSRLVLLFILLAAIVVSLGAFTRLVDAGLGCPDWPGCYGHIMWPESQAEIDVAQQAFPDAPVDTDKTWPEMVHRYFASALGFCILCMTVFSWRQRSESHQPVKLITGLLVLVIVQGLFGMWTVTLKLWPQVVTVHLLGGFSTLSLLWLLFLRLSHRDWQVKTSLLSLDKAQFLRLRLLASKALIVVVLQISLGGWTTSNYAALACIDFPTCHGEWLPTADFVEGFNITQKIGPNYLGGMLDNDARTAIHWTHRLGALLVSIVSVILMVLLWRTGNKNLRILSAATGVILCLQVALGITNIVAVLPLSVAVAHNGVGAILLLVMVTVNYRLYCHTAISSPEKQ